MSIQAVEVIDQELAELTASSKDGGQLEIFAVEPLITPRTRRPAIPRHLSITSIGDLWPDSKDAHSPISLSYPSYLHSKDLPILPSHSPPSSPTQSKSPLYFPRLVPRFIYRIQDYQLFWIVMYFAFNLMLTLYNKVILVRFPFPYTLTALHSLFGTIGGSILIQQGVYKPAKLTMKETFVLFCFSLLYSCNIIVSNTSLHLVTVAFHQVVRAVTPIFTLILSVLLLGRTSSWNKVISLTPIVIGVGLATYGDYYCTKWGFFLTLFGTLLGAFKTILTNVLQAPLPTVSETDLKSKKYYWFSLRTFQFPRLHPLDLLHILLPFAFIQCALFAYFTGELEQVRQYSVYHMTYERALALCLNGFIAFGLNIVSFNANKSIGPLGMTVAANVKQVLTILCSVGMFNLTISLTNGAGIFLTLFGGAWFARVQYLEKRKTVREG